MENAGRGKVVSAVINWAYDQGVLVNVCESVWEEGYWFRCRSGCFMWIGFVWQSAVVVWGRVLGDSEYDCDEHFKVHHQKGQSHCQNNHQKNRARSWWSLLQSELEGSCVLHSPSHLWCCASFLRWCSADLSARLHLGPLVNLRYDIDKTCISDFNISYWYQHSCDMKFWMHTFHCRARNLDGQLFQGITTRWKGLPMVVHLHHEDLLLLLKSPYCHDIVKSSPLCPEVNKV